MKEKQWLFLFVLVLAVNSIGSQLNNDLLQYISKPLIIPFLAGYFWVQTNFIANKIKKWIFFALFFSWAGDILLMFVPTNDNFFLLGLASFLIAHIFYIVFFHHVRVKENIQSNLWLLIVVVVYYVVLITWLSPYLDDMKLPVRIYGVVISVMLMLAMHMLSLKNKIAGNWMMWGAVLFVISDSVLAINKFYQPFEVGNVIIMLTYGLAQLFIVTGAIRYLQSVNSHKI